LAGVILVNAHAGADATSADDLRRLFVGAELVACEPDKLGRCARQWAGRRPDYLGVAGGDGSIRTVVAALRDSDVPLVVVPEGTRNHFAKELGISSLDDAADAARGATVRRVDCGDVNGEAFVNNSSIGLYPALVMRRELHERRLPKWAANIVAAADQVGRRPHRFRVVVDGREYEAWMVFVGNGPYGTGRLDLTSREALDAGVLDVRVVRADLPAARLRLVFALLFGRLGRSALIVSFQTDGVHVALDPTQVNVALDGEVVVLESPLHYRSMPGSLACLVPSSP
jgi:undecaprenyl-diphosphatase